MRCYNLVFNFKIFCHNYGSIITLALFVVYVCFIIYYGVKDISPLKLEISRLVFQEKKEEQIMAFDAKKPKRNKSIKKLKIDKKVINAENNPPKKGIVRKTVVLTTQADNMVTNTENYEFLDYKKSTRRKSKIKSKREKNESTKYMLGRDKNSEKTTVNKNKKLDLIKYEETKDKKFLEKTDVKGEKAPKERTEKNKYKEQYDDYELNNMDYQDASENDNRSCLRTYWSVLKRENYIFITFIACNDYNLFYVKIERFFILLCTEMTLNGLFFIHESMHRKYTEGQDFTFVQKLPQYIFTILVGDIIEVILCYLSMTDKHIYDIKDLVRTDKNKNKNLEKNDKKEKKDPNDKRELGEKILNILDCMKNKLAGFFIFTFFLFLFYWYFISAFCAVYQNTQIVFLRDSGISLLTSVLESLIIYAATTIIRTITLVRCCRKKLGCLYKLSDLIPIF